MPSSLSTNQRLTHIPPSVSAPPGEYESGDNPGTNLSGDNPGTPSGDNPGTIPHRDIPMLSRAWFVYGVFPMLIMHECLWV